VTTPKKAPAKAAPKAAKTAATAQKKSTAAKPVPKVKTAAKTKPVTQAKAAKATKAAPVKAKPVTQAKAAKATKAAPLKAKPVTQTKSAKAAPVKAKPVKAVPAKAKPVAAPAAKPKSSPTSKTAVQAKSPAAKQPTGSAKSVKSQPPLAKTVAAKPSVSKPSAVKASSKKSLPAPQVKPMTVQTSEAVEASIAPIPVTPVAADQPVRAARPSARLAQITVPSLPPAVASTAAKSSFLPSSAPPAQSVPFAPIKKDAKLANNWKSKKVDALTDAEILAMPDDEYMNDTQLAYFRRKLSILKQDILNSAGATTEHLREDTVVVPDPADRATIEEEHALELRTRDRERKLLKKIEQSIHRIDAGDYGFCDETGEAIGVGRLLARPTATLSLEAQQRRELKQKMFGD
jgi:DnaK suppressor protein